MGRMTRATNREAAALAGKVIIVSGASSGIGEALARRLVDCGARVIGLARRAERLDALEAELGAERFRGFVVDVADADACRSAIARVREEIGRIDGVICNAGVSMNAAFDQASFEVFHQMMAVNYFGAMYLARLCAEDLAASRGSLIFVSSIVGKRGFATRSGYAAAKFAVHGLFESLRAEWRDRGVHVGLVAPGYAQTEIRERALAADGAPRGENGFTTGDVMTADQAAAAIVDCMAKKRRECILTAGGKAMVWLNKLLPSVADRVAARVVR